MNRQSYGHPVVAKQIVDGRARTLPAGLVKNFAGFPNFLNITLYDKTGKKIVDRLVPFCPNGEGRRTHPNAPDTSRYPSSCPGNPFTLGSVWGIQSGWAVRTEADERPVRLLNGTYTAKAVVHQNYRNQFGIPATPLTFRVTVRAGSEAGNRLARTNDQPQPKPNAARPKGPDRVPDGPKPDLRSLPAWAIRAVRGEGSQFRRDYLQFNANVWNAGPSNLVVDGFRRSGQDLMDAYQYFYNDKGQQVGHAKTGTMEWDAKDGHHHWHFTDFAMYRLLKSDLSQAVRSQKEAFCLANTDQIDLTVPNANWRPDNTDLHSACGEYDSVAVREVLDVGSGDTYVQDVAGQSFDITSVPNGTYYVQVIANPTKRLFESNLNNNGSLRKVILGGRPGARTVQVPPHQLINAP